MTPAARVEDLFVRPDGKTGEIRIQANLRNAMKGPAQVRLSFAVAPAADGETLDTLTLDRLLPPGDTLIETTLKISQPRLWSLGDPNLYRVTARATIDGSASFDETSTRCGFRDFRFENGGFRLNGKRVFLRSSHSGNEAPVGLRVPLDPDLLRRDLLNCKVMGFNMIRFFCAIPRRYQLDLCDEIGFLVYEESLAGWCLEESAQMPERFDTSIRGMIRRDRNHPSVVMWGLLNENMGDAAFYHAVPCLPFVRGLDDTRVVMLNSGRFDMGRNRLPASWYAGAATTSIMVSHNGLKEPMGVADSTWAPGQFSLHPGLNGQYSVVRWTAPEAGEYAISAAMAGLCRKPTTTDIHVYRNNTPLFDGFINVHGLPNTAKFAKTLTVDKGDKISVIVGIGDGNPYSDTTALAMTIKSPQGKVDDVAADFSTKSNPNGPWSYGWLAPAQSPIRRPSPFTPRRSTSSRSPSAASAIPAPASGKTCWPTSTLINRPHTSWSKSATSANAVPANRCSSRNMASPAPSIWRARCGITSKSGTPTRQTPNSIADCWTSSWPIGGGGRWTRRSPIPKITSANAWPRWPPCGCRASTPSAPIRAAWVTV